MARFASLHRGLRERLGEFVAAFPLHPDGCKVLGRLPFLNDQQRLRLLAEALAKVRNEPVPEEGPGLISCDAYWDWLRALPLAREVMEVDAVLDFGQGLARHLEKSLADPGRKALAVRLVHALCLHRLASGEVYGNHGATAAELADELIPSVPGPQDLTVAPEARVEAGLRSLLEEIVAAGGAYPLGLEVETGRYGLRLRKFKRFARPELLLHWTNAVPFVLLMATGVVMLVSRFFEVDRRTLAPLEILHQVFALVWLCGLPLAFLSNPRVHRRNLRAVCRWGVEDFLWVFQSIRGVYNKRVTPGPVGRFNTGQKINFCLVVVYFLAFAASGSLMFFRGSMLFPWYLHTALFFAALGSVGGHLYLSLVHPGTRVALTGIFHGWTSMEYVRHHHPLSLPADQRPPAEPVPGRTAREEVFAARVELLMLVLVLALGTVGAFVFGKARLVSARQGFAKAFADTIKPSQLSTKHRIGPLTESCIKCHAYSGSIPDNRCEQCHQVVKERRTAKIGYHGTLHGACIECHKEHEGATVSLIPLKREQFNHNLAAFKLEGKHAAVACDDCHQKKRPAGAPGVYYIGLAYGTCAACHPDRHAGQFAAGCETCHTLNGWTGKTLKFSHEADSAFKLAGKHAAVDCSKCHVPKAAGQPLATARFKGLAVMCAACHADPHEKQFAATCDVCHTPASWKRPALVFQHDRDSKFPLAARHADLACEKCHVPKAPGEPLAATRLHGLPADCVDCHPDPHRGQFARACTPCHTPAGWKGKQLAFDHAKDSKYPLVAKHVEVKCDKCHVPPAPGSSLSTAPFRGLHAACADCHADPHRGQFERACTRCHPTPTGWGLKQQSFQHDRDTKFALEGKHVSVECAKCHPPPLAGGTLAAGVFRGLGTGCAVCHNVNHPEIYGPACLSCHDTLRWTKQRPAVEHFLKRTVDGEFLAGKHLTVECRGCHAPARLPMVTTASQPGYSCVTCHGAQDPHKGTLGAVCTKCHDLEGWKGEHLLFNHDKMTRYPLDQDHRNVACAKCHKNLQWKPLDDKCQSCHPHLYDKNKK